ncbi:MAG: NAD-dependent epimerase/dehydratase family protein [Deltaproteobacteria bacterium]|nr:NAD-dependent epimerase/dehydratase family protein [Deltaproteobacteria bacterium]MBI3391424.1 NAD-dependent epimerase/dehydratase family protein [Deltaproteobacteria bacterium]
MSAPLVAAVTGASSFTGLWIARELQARGWEVHALCPRAADEYAGLRGLRVQLLQESVRVHFDVRAEDGGFARWVRSHRPAVWVHHHHWMEAFRSPDYDVAAATRIGLDPLPDLVAALAESAAHGVIYSGSFFEPGEGGNSVEAAATPYAHSKRAVWEALARLATSAGVLVSKIVIPNPIGPLENDERVVPTLIRHTLTRTKFVLNTPAAVSDYLPWSHLARIYEQVARDLIDGRGRIVRPAGLLATAREWVDIVRRDLIERRLHLTPCEVEAASGSAGSSFRNPDDERTAIEWDHVWDDYAAWITRLDLLRTWATD